MPIDTAAKRRSAGSVAGVPWVAGVTPDATTPVAWRQQAGWSYSGIAAGEPEAPTVHTVTGTWEVPTRTGTWEVGTHTGTWEVPARTGTWEVPT